MMARSSAAAAAAATISGSLSVSDRIELRVSESCEAVERELDKVLAKFGLVSDHFERTVEDRMEALKALKAQYDEVEEDYQLTPDQIKILLEAGGKAKETVARLASDHRDLHSSVSKVGKAIDRNFNPDFGAITRDGLFIGERAKILTQVLAQHLYRQGLLDIGDGLSKEGGLELEGQGKEPFVELHRILEALKGEDLTPALEWSAENREALISQGSSLEFKLHRLAFLNLVKRGRGAQGEAIAYARTNFPPFVKRHEREVQTLMGCLLYAPGGLSSGGMAFPAPPQPSPYSHLFDSSLWEDIQEVFTRDACARLGLSVDSPLAVCFAAGCTGLPALLNICQVMQARQVSSIWNGKDELPIEIDLGKEFHYHSVFACPILRQQASESNPPMRLICGHVISRDALHKLASANKLKCPYCPGEQSPNDARQITF